MYSLTLTIVLMLIVGNLAQFIPPGSPGKGRIRMAPQIFSVEADSQRIARMGPNGAVYGIPICFPQTFLAGGYSITVTLSYPYNMWGDPGSSMRFVLYGVGLDMPGGSCILDNGGSGDNQNCVFPKKVNNFMNTATAPFPSADLPWIANNGGLSALYLYVQEDQFNNVALPYTIEVMIWYSASPQFAPGNTMPFYAMREDPGWNGQPAAARQPLTSSTFGPLMTRPPPYAPLTFFVPLTWNVRQLVAPIGGATTARFQYRQSCPSCVIPGQGGSWTWLQGAPYKIALPVCPPLGQTNFTVRVSVQATDPRSFFDMVICRPTRILTFTNFDVTGYGCRSNGFPFGYTQIYSNYQGSLFADFAVNNMTMLFLTVYSRAQWMNGNPNSRSNFLISATAYPGQNLTAAQWSNLFGPQMRNGVNVMNLWNNVYPSNGGTYSPLDS